VARMVEALRDTATKGNGRLLLVLADELEKKP
jgi:hypothetical protein